MNKITVGEFLTAVSGRLITGSGDVTVSGVKHDSRECSAGDLFVAVCGENHDGHQYIPAVLEAGASAVMVSHEGAWADKAAELGVPVIMVEDTVYAMGELAKYYLETLDIKKVAVTGSVGKTSVRDMTYYVLSEKYNCGRNMKNYNNEIGLPLSVFQFDDSTEAAVLEMGMSDFGEIDRLAEIVKPDIGIITNIGVSHIENLGSREGIFRAKMELAGHIAENGTLIFAESDILTKASTAGNYSQISVGTSDNDDYIISDVDDRGIGGIEFTLEHGPDRSRIGMPVPGVHNAVNSSLAIAAGSVLGITIEEAIRGLEKTELTGRRLRVIRGERLDVIDDTYNASPDSMKSALKVLEQSSFREGAEAHRVAVLGDMFELGSESMRQHREVGEFAGKLGIDLLIAVGCDAKYICEGASDGGLKSVFFSSKEELLEEIDDLTGDGDIVLVKGSRGMKMEQAVEKLLGYQEL